MTAPARPPRPRAAGPRTVARPMPEMPAEGYAPYRLWGRLPREAGWRARLLDWLGGRECRLLYVGITARSGFVRWAEHSDDKTWARDVSYAERDDEIRWPTLYDAVIGDDGDLVLVVDAAQDEGLRPARPGELVDPFPLVRQFRGGTVRVFRPDPAGQPVRGTVIEGARTGERRLIHTEAPVHNIEHNEGNALAVNRRRRILPRHHAAWRRSAGHLALVWLLVASLLTWLLDAGDGWRAGLATVGRAVAGAAVLILLAQLARQAVRGRAAVALNRQRTRRRRVRRGRRR